MQKKIHRIFSLFIRRTIRGVNGANGKKLSDHLYGHDLHNLQWFILGSVWISAGQYLFAFSVNAWNDVAGCSLVPAGAGSGYRQLWASSSKHSGRLRKPAQEGLTIELPAVDWKVQWPEWRAFVGGWRWGMQVLEAGTTMANATVGLEVPERTHHRKHYQKPVLRFSHWS